LSITVSVTVEVTPRENGHGLLVTLKENANNFNRIHPVKMYFIDFNIFYPLGFGIICQMI